MTEIYSFLFSLALGMTARLLIMLAGALGKRVDLAPVTFVLDMTAVSISGGAFIAYIIISGAVLAPYMFAALGSGYLAAYLITRKRKK